VCLDASAEAAAHTTIAVATDVMSSARHGSPESVPHPGAAEKGTVFSARIKSNRHPNTS